MWDALRRWTEQQGGGGRSGSLCSYCAQVARAPCARPLCWFDRCARAVGAPRRIDDIAVPAVVTRTLEGVPAEAKHWSTRSMAKASGLLVSTVGRIWRALLVYSRIAAKPLSCRATRALSRRLAISSVSI